MSVKTLTTAEEFLEMATSAPCELVRGVVVEAIQVFRTDGPPARFDRSSELISDVLPGFKCRVVDFFSQS